MFFNRPKAFRGDAYFEKPGFSQFVVSDLAITYDEFRQEADRAAPAS